MPLRDGLSLDGERPGKIVLLILDGLGDAYLRTRGGGSRLLAARRGSLTSVFVHHRERGNDVSPASRPPFMVSTAGSRAITWAS